jgi:hypothetical protein
MKTAFLCVGLHKILLVWPAQKAMFCLPLHLCVIMDEKSLLPRVKIEEQQTKYLRTERSLTTSKAEKTNHSRNHHLSSFMKGFQIPQESRKG